MEDILKNDVVSEVNEALAAHQDEIAKAAETVATSTFSPADRSVFSPENLDEKIKLLVPTETPLRNRLPRVEGFGQATSWKKMTSKLNVNVADGGTSTTIAFADAAAPGETSQTYAVVSAAYKLLGRKIEVGVLANKASQGRGEAMMDHRERIKMYEVMLGEEEMIIQGNATTRTTEFDGLGAQVTTNSGTMTMVTVSGLGTYCKSLYDAGASPTLLLVNAAQMQMLANNLSSSGSIQRLVVNNNDSSQSGLTVGSAVSRIINPVDGSLIDVRTSRYVGNQAYLLTERSTAGENWIEMEDLIPMSRIDVPSTVLSTVAFVFEASVLKVIGEPFQYKFNGLATSA
jgi:hypothetical protein